MAYRTLPAYRALWRTVTHVRFLPFSSVCLLMLCLALLSACASSAASRSVDASASKASRENTARASFGPQVPTPPDPAEQQADALQYDMFPSLADDGARAPESTALAASVQTTLTDPASPPLPSEQSAQQKTPSPQTSTMNAAAPKAPAPTAPPAVPTKTAAPKAPVTASSAAPTKASTPKAKKTTSVTAPTDSAAARVVSALQKNAAKSTGDVAACWLPLVERLQNDPKASKEIVTYFCNLPEYSPDPMGAKVKELFRNAFLRKKTPSGPKRPAPRIYRNVVTEANMRKCQDFLTRNEAIFDAVEKKYPVPREVLAALLFVETRLGTYVGKDNAFWSLACMAAADKPELVQGGIQDLPITEQHASWLQSKLDDKSAWAYNELRALLTFCTINKLDPHVMPGSVYGAIGICQFMPSNLKAYGEDGDGDGVINLFSEPDAIFSAARYLTKHGWKKDIAVSGQRSVLKRYNNLNVYANTILALGESLRTDIVQTGPPDDVTVTAKKTTRKSRKK